MGYLEWGRKGAAGSGQELLPCSLQECRLKHPQATTLCVGLHGWDQWYVWTFEEIIQFETEQLDVFFRRWYRQGAQQLCLVPPSAPLTCWVWTQISMYSLAGKSRNVFSLPL